MPMTTADLRSMEKMPACATGREFGALRRSLGISRRVVAVLLGLPSTGAMQRLERSAAVLSVEERVRWQAALDRAAARQAGHTEDDDVEMALRTVANMHTRARRGERMRAWARRQALLSSRSSSSEEVS
jgi:hypothetical protein